MKNTNKQFLILWIFLFLLAGCNNANREKELALKEGKIELSKKESEPKGKPTIIDSVSSNIQEKSNSQSVSKTENNTTEISDGRLSGKHNLTIQWISWTKPGAITFNSIGNNKYEVEGFQQGSKSEKCPECYLKVKGTIIEVTPKKLRFTGKIESSIHHIQGGEPCIKEGTFDFVSTKKRKYWRCQNMKGCDGVTDYVDIYF